MPSNDLSIIHHALGLTLVVTTDKPQTNIDQFLFHNTCYEKFKELDQQVIRPKMIKQW